MSIAITSFYRFVRLADAEIRTVQARLERTAATESVRGLVLLAHEGINATVSGRYEAVEKFKAAVREVFGPDILFKDSTAAKHPFLVFKVKVKPEIVSLGQPNLVPKSSAHHHLTPAEWREAMRDPDTVVLDTRNDYEVDIGKFRGAVDFRLGEFNEFPDKLKVSGLAKDRKVLIYCTGGIRCEKAILEMQRQGYQSVHQLGGGILKYIEEFPEQEFAGECFVFDYRVALDQKLAPTRQYLLCPHCGQPAQEKIVCAKCGRAETLCKSCVSTGISTCSKNCAHHAEIGSNSSRRHQQEIQKRSRS